MERVWEGRRKRGAEGGRRLTNFWLVYLKRKRETENVQISGLSNKKNETAPGPCTHTATRHTPHTSNRALTYVYFGVMYVRGK